MTAVLYNGLRTCLSAIHLGKRTWDLSMLIVRGSEALRINPATVHLWGKWATQIQVTEAQSRYLRNGVRQSGKIYMCVRNRLNSCQEARSKCDANRLCSCRRSHWHHQRRQIQQLMLISILSFIRTRKYFWPKQIWCLRRHWKILDIEEYQTTRLNIR